MVKAAKTLGKQLKLGEFLLETIELLLSLQVDYVGYLLHVHTHTHTHWVHIL